MREQIKQEAKQVILAVLVLIGVLLLIVWFFFYSGNVFVTPARNAPNRAAIARLYNAVNVGDSYRSVLEAYFEERTGELKLIVSTPRLLRIITPYEFGSNNWVLVVEFTGDSVSAVRVLTSDGPAPLNGPKDKVR